MIVTGRDPLGNVAYDVMGTNRAKFLADEDTKSPLLAALLDGATTRS
jgi:hypothetical protein